MPRLALFSVILLVDMEMFIIDGRLKKHTGIETGGEKVVMPIANGETKIITKFGAQNYGETLPM